MDSKKNHIIDYYETCETDYQFFWDLDKSMSMHAGYWDDSIKTLREALNKENEILAKYADIKSTDRILDAGCGVGGSSIYLAKSYGCQVLGITLSPKQVLKARLNAAKENVPHLASFEEMDFCDLKLSNQTFDVVWALESICHAEDKVQFIREAHRILKPFGRLIIADGFAIKKNLNTLEAKNMSSWLNGWGVNSIECLEDFKQNLDICGFEDIAFYDITKNVMPSSKRLYWISLSSWILSKMGEWVGLRKKIQTDNIKSGYYQYVTLKENLWKYCVFYARKKKRN